MHVIGTIISAALIIYLTWTLLGWVWDRVVYLYAQVEIYFLDISQSISYYLSKEPFTIAYYIWMIVGSYSFIVFAFYVLFDGRVKIANAISFTVLAAVLAYTFGTNAHLVRVNHYIDSYNAAEKELTRLKCKYSEPQNDAVKTAHKAFTAGFSWLFDKSPSNNHKRMAEQNKMSLQKMEELEEKEKLAWEKCEKENANYHAKAEESQVFNLKFIPNLLK